MDHPEYGIPREDLGNFTGVVWRETAPRSGRYVPAVPPQSKGGATWPQAVMIASMFLSFAAVIWAIAWAVK